MDDHNAIARTVLEILPDNAATEFEDLYKHGELTDSKVLSDSLPWMIADYDLDRTQIIRLPASARHLTELIEHHLLNGEHSTPWALSHRDAIILRISDQLYARTGQVLLFSLCFITKLLHRLFPRDRMTPAEVKTVMQLLSGMTLKQAAEQGFVTYETKKTHLKSVFQKTQINRQQDLSTLLIIHLTLDVAAKWSREQSKGACDEVFFNYCDNYLGRRVRTSVIKESGRRFRLLELGDLSGEPFVCIHHLGLFHFNEQEIDALYEKGIRFICPLRNGALGPSDEYLSDEQNFKHTIKGIELACSLIPSKKARIVTLQSGCHYALAYALRKPDSIEKLIFLGASPVPEFEPAKLSAFMRGLQALALKHRITLKAAITFLNRRVSHPAQLKKVMLEVYKHGEADTRVIERLFSDHRQVHAMQCRLKESSLSIAQDFRIRASADWVQFQGISENIEIHFVHGDDDKLVPIDSVSALARQRPNTYLHSVSSAGNLLFDEHTTKVLAVLQRITLGEVPVCLDLLSV